MPPCDVTWIVFIRSLPLLLQLMGSQSGHSQLDSDWLFVEEWSHSTGRARLIDTALYLRLLLIRCVRSCGVHVWADGDVSVYSRAVDAAEAFCRQMVSTHQHAIDGTSLLTRSSTPETSRNIKKRLVFTSLTWYNFFLCVWRCWGWEDVEEILLPE